MPKRFLSIPTLIFILLSAPAYAGHTAGFQLYER